jgi:hypothetical protein
MKGSGTFPNSTFEPDRNGQEETKLERSHPLDKESRDAEQRESSSMWQNNVHRENINAIWQSGIIWTEKNPVHAVAPQRATVCIFNANLWQHFNNGGGERASELMQQVPLSPPPVWGERRMSCGGERASLSFSLSLCVLRVL